MAVRVQQQLQEQHQEVPPPQAPAPPLAPPTERAPAAAPKGGASRPERQPKGRSAAERAAAADRTVGTEPPEARPGTPPADGEPPKQKAEAKPSGAGEVDIPAEARTALGALLVAGSLPELAAKLGVDAKAVDASGKKLSLVRERVKEAEAKVAQANAKEAEANAIRVECKQAYGPPHLARKAVDAGKFADAAQWMEKVLDMPFAEFTRQVALATKGMAPEALAAFQKDRELKAREEALAAKERRTTDERSQAERDAKATKTIETKCSGHDALKLTNGSKMIMAVLHDHFDAKTGAITIGYKQAADLVLGQFEAQAKALGYTRGGAPPAPVAAPKAEPPVVPGKRDFTPPEPETEEPPAGTKRRGTSFEERSARASRQFERSRPL